MEKPLQPQKTKLKIINYESDTDSNQNGNYLETKNYMVNLVSFS